MKYVLLLGASLVIGCARSGDESSRVSSGSSGKVKPSTSRQEFYRIALGLAEESYAGHSSGEGPWVEVDVKKKKRMEEEYEEKKQTELAALEKVRSERQLKKTKLEERFKVMQKNLDPLKDKLAPLQAEMLRLVEKCEADEKKLTLLWENTYATDRLYYFNPSTNPAAYAKILKNKQLVQQLEDYKKTHEDKQADALALDRCRAQYSSIESEISELKSTIRDTSDELSDVSRTVDEPDTLLYQDSDKPLGKSSYSMYTMTVGDIKSRLGKPHSILKQGRWLHTWYYKFPDGMVTLKIEAYAGVVEKGLDYDDTRAVLNPAEVEMY